MGWNDEWSADASHSSGDIKRYNDHVFKCVQGIEDSSLLNEFSLTTIDNGHYGTYTSSKICDIYSHWTSSQEKGGIDGVAWVGFDFGAGIKRKVLKVVFYQDSWGEYSISSVKLQKSDDGSTWEDVTTISKSGYHDFTYDTEFSCRAVRILANADISESSGHWEVNYAEVLLSPDTDPDHWQKLTGGMLCNF